MREARRETRSSRSSQRKQLNNCLCDFATFAFLSVGGVPQTLDRFTADSVVALDLFGR